MMEYVPSRSDRERSDYLVEKRRLLHLYPELGMNTVKTAAILGEALDGLGIPYTERYCDNSLVAVIGSNPNLPMIAYRADMDALPIGEETGLDFASLNQGCMHACGHDAHMAILLGVAASLKDSEDSLPFRFKLIFQPSEEEDVSGAETMIGNGVLDDVDCVLCAHVDGHLDTGRFSCRPGPVGTAAMPMELTFHGKAAHATRPTDGHDALAMAVRTYEGLQVMQTREISPFDSVVCSVGALNGGKVHNIVCSRAEMKLSLRAYSQELVDFMVERTKLLARHAAEELGGSVDILAEYGCPPIINDPFLSKCFHAGVEKALGSEAVRDLPPGMGSDDFAWYGRLRPSIYFRVGVRNTAKHPAAEIHNSNFTIDEDALLLAEKAVIAALYEIAGRR